MARGCSDWHGTRAALRGERGPPRADPGARARRPRRVRAQRRPLAPRPAGGRRRATARRQRPPGPLDARGARGRGGAGRRRAGRPDPRLALPRRRQRRAQHARAADRSALRASCARASASTPRRPCPLHESADFGWHPSLAGLRELYDAGKVAVLPAVDYSHPDQSHFNSGGFWRSGIVGPAPDRTGWLGRTLDVIGSHDNPLQGIHVGWGQDPSMNGHRAPVATVSSPGDFGFYIPDVWDEKSFLPDLPPPLAGTRQAPGAGRGALDVRATRSTRTTASRRWPRRTRRRRHPLAVPRQRSRQGVRQSGAHARRGLRHARRHDLERRLRHPRRPGDGARAICSRTSATRCAPGRPTSTRAGSRSACSR